MGILIRLWGYIPTPWNLIVAFGLIATILGSAFGAGYHCASVIEEAKAAQALTELISHQQELAKADAEASSKAAAERDTLAARNTQILSAMDALMASRPKYKDCRIDPDVAAKINEVLK